MIRKTLAVAAVWMIGGPVVLGQAVMGPGTGPANVANPLEMPAPAPAPQPDAQRMQLTYGGEYQGAPVLLELFGLGSTFGGVFTLNGQSFPLTGRLSAAANVLEGTWQYNGQAVPFQSTLGGETMTLATDGVQMQLRRRAGGVAASPVAPFEPQPQPQPLPQASPPGSALPTSPAAGKVHDIDGNAFHYAVPAGWQAQESDRSVLVASPDGAQAFGLVLMPNVRVNSPDELMRAMFEGMGVRDLKVLDAKPQTDGDAQVLVANVAFGGRDGQPRQAMMRVTLGRTANGGNLGIVSFVSCTAQGFDSAAPGLISLVKQIRPRK
jgi:hypothetical protein